METREFIIRARLDAQILETWIEAGWLLPRRDGMERDFSDVDLARAQLIADLERLGVNQEGVPVILDLVDQLHGMRRTLRDLLSAIHAQPEPMRRSLIAGLRAVAVDQSADRRVETPSTDGDDSR